MLKTLLIVLLIVLVLSTVVAIWCMFRISSQYSREEEQRLEQENALFYERS